jgi:hypothetical protein
MLIIMPIVPCHARYAGGGIVVVDGSGTPRSAHHLMRIYRWSPSAPVR